MTNDLMRRLAAARPAELNPAARPTEATRGAELATITAAAREVAMPSAVRRGRGSPGRLPVWGMATAGATAAAVLAVTAFASGALGPAGGGMGRAGAGSTAQSGGGAGGEAGPTVLSARAVLLAAAHEADKGAADVGKYWHVKSTSRGLFRAADGGSGYTIVSRESSEGWQAFDPTNVSWATQRYLGGQPLSDADRTAWRRAGSPAKFNKYGKPVSDNTGQPLAPGRPAFIVRGPDDAVVTWKGRPTTLKELAKLTRGMDGRISVSNLTGGDTIFWLGRNVSMRDLWSLPSDPTRLKADLLRWYGGHGTESDSQQASSDEWLFDVVQGLILDMPVQPKVRAAAFRMLAGLADVRVIDGVKTESGRIGTAVAITKKTPFGVQEDRIIFDRRTGMGIGTAIVAVRPKDPKAGFAPGTVLASQDLVADWTDVAPDLLK